MEHTPGPWKVEHIGEPNDIWFLFDTSGRQLADIFGHHDDSEASTDPSSKEGAANASLIKEAPNLLALLQELLQHGTFRVGWIALDDGLLGYEWALRTQDAISKATGGA